MATPWHPRNDQDLAAFVTTFLANTGPVKTALSLHGSWDADLVTLLTAFETALSTHIASQNQAQADRVAKDDAKDALIDELQRLVRELRGYSTFDNTMTSSLGLPLHDTIPTPVTAGSEVPTLFVDTNAPQHHRISFVQLSTEGGESRGKPSWSRAIRIMYAIVESGESAPAIEAMQFLAMDTATPYEWDIPGEHRGKDIWYRGAWETPRGELGQWSDPAKGTVRG